MTELMQRIIESKNARRRELAALPFLEKVKILERMRERQEFIKKVRRVKPANPEQSHSRCRNGKSTTDPERSRCTDGVDNRPGECRRKACPCGDAGRSP